MKDRCPWITALVLLTACAPSRAPDPTAPVERRAIFISFDAMNEARVRATVDPAAIPNLLRFFDEASCTDGARPMWPSLTAASHAALWTGVYGNVNGVTANAQSPLPWGEFSLADPRSGFDARELRAEPIWISAVRQGRSVVAHHSTQAGYPGRWRPEGGRDTVAVRRDSMAIGDPRLFMVNGYTGGPEPRLLTSARFPTHPAPPWRNTDQLGPVGVPFREVSWTAGSDSLFALFFGSDRYQEIVVSSARDVAQGVRVRPAPAEWAPPEGRELARFFSEVLWVAAPGGRGGFYFRLWALAPDLSSYELYQSARNVQWTNQPAVLRSYEDAVGGFVGNTAWNVLRETVPTIERGGDGSAELKYLETAELETRQMIRGSEWTWRTRRPALQTDYFSLADDIDHSWFGLVSPGVPGNDPAAMARISSMRARGWSMVDRRIAALRTMAVESGALLVMSGDHGMRPIWRFFHVNTALRRAGLLAVDSTGRPDLSRTRAMSPSGYYVTVNRVGRKGGIVTPDRVDRIVDSVIAALRGTWGNDGAPIVSDAWRVAEDDSLGRGGPSGGDVYFALGPGYYYNGMLNDSVTTGRTPFGNHGFPSTDSDMQTVLCAVGPGVGGRRLPTARVIDAAPTVSAWLGITAPADARGVSLLERMKSQP